MKKLYDGLCKGLYKSYMVLLYIIAIGICIVAFIVAPIGLLELCFNLAFWSAVKWYLIIIAGIAAICLLYKLISHGEELVQEEQELKSFNQDKESENISP